MDMHLFTFVVLPVLSLFVSCGDGWLSAVYVLQNTSSLADANEGVATSGTLASGSEGFDWLCLADGCYELSLCGGSADSEIGFEFLDEVRILNYDDLLTASSMIDLSFLVTYRLGGISKT